MNEKEYLVLTSNGSQQLTVWAASFTINRNGDLLFLDHKSEPLQAFNRDHWRQVYRV